jgi:hypothetical protein
MQSSQQLATAMIMSLLFLSSCSEQTSGVGNAEALRTSTKQKFAEIEKLSRQSCLCHLSDRISPILTGKLKRATQGLKIEGAGESSAPLAGSYDCFPELGGKACVSKFYITIAETETYVCTLGQLRRLENAWQTGLSSTDPRRMKSKAALMAELEKIQGELKTSIPPMACE